MEAYLKRGGHSLVTLRPNSSPGEPDPEAALIKMLGGWGVQVGDDVIVDQVVRLFAGPALGLNPVVNAYGAHPITNGFSQRTVFPMTRSVEPESQLKAGLTVVGLAKTSDTSWAETDLVGIFQKQTAKFDDKDRKGPVDVADAVDGDLKTLGFGKDGQAKMVVIGSTDFANNQYFNQFFNRDFTVNSVDWLAGEEKSISNQTANFARLGLPSHGAGVQYGLCIVSAAVTRGAVDFGNRGVVGAAQLESNPASYRFRLRFFCGARSEC